MSGAYHLYHGQKEWFDVDDAVKTIGDAIEKLRDVGGPGEEALCLLESITFVQSEMEARDGCCECACCEDEREDAQRDEAIVYVPLLSQEACVTLLKNVGIQCHEAEDVVTLREAVESNIKDATINHVDVLAY